jgi:hypothetical protein
MRTGQVEITVSVASKSLGMACMAATPLSTDSYVCLRLI